VMLEVSSSVIVICQVHASTVLKGTRECFKEILLAVG
jgi:hypothetical protein